MYREHAAAPLLRPWVECYWTRHGALAEPLPPRDRVLPDGCVDLLFELSGVSGGDLLALVVGTMTRPLAVPRLEAMDFLGVRFRAGRAAAFLPLPVDRLTDERADGAELLGPAMRELACRVAEARPGAARFALLDAFLLRRLEPGRTAAAALAAIDAIVAAPAGLSVSRLARRLGVSRQHLTREVRRHAGVGPKRLGRVFRFQAALAAARQDASSWADAAAAHGYSDQAHLAREFRELSGLSPAALLASRPPVPFLQDAAARS